MAHKAEAAEEERNRRDEEMLQSTSAAQRPDDIERHIMSQPPDRMNPSSRHTSSR